MLLWPEGRQKDKRWLRESKVFCKQPYAADKHGRLEEQRLMFAIPHSNSHHQDLFIAIYIKYLQDDFLYNDSSQEGGGGHKLFVSNTTLDSVLARS